MSNSKVLSPDRIRAAVTRYFEATRSMNAAQWASVFAPNAVVEDPIGQPPLTTLRSIVLNARRFHGIKVLG